MEKKNILVFETPCNSVRISAKVDHTPLVLEQYYSLSIQPFLTADPHNC